MITSFSVPESLEQHVDERILDTHEWLAACSLDDITDRMVAACRPDTTANTAGYVDLKPQEDFDETKVIAMPFPFGNGWAPHMAIRAFMLQYSLDEPTRLVLFPNDKDSYDLSKQDIETIASGDSTPMAEAQLNTLLRLIPSLESVSYLGYSQGATVGAAALKLAASRDIFNLTNSGLFEPPNVVPNATAKDLQKRFTSGGIAPLNKAINDSGIPALSQAQRSRGGLDVPAQLLNFAKVYKNSKQELPKAQHEGFTKPLFWRDLNTALQKSPDAGMNVTVAAGTESVITPAAFMDNLEKIAHHDSRLHTLSVEGYGHEMGDNVVVHAVLAKLALNAADK